MSFARFCFWCTSTTCQTMSLICKLVFVLADDTKLLAPNSTLHNCLPELETRTINNSMEFHPSKSRVANFYGEIPSYKFLHEDVEVNASQKDLSLVTGNLSWSEHNLSQTQKGISVAFLSEENSFNNYQLGSKTQCL